jgi:hypothetical protein
MRCKASGTISNMDGYGSSQLFEGIIGEIAANTTNMNVASEVDMEPP